MRPTSSGIKPYAWRSVGSTRSSGLYVVGEPGVEVVKKGRCFSKSLLSSEPGVSDMGRSEDGDAENEEEEEEREERSGEPKPIEPLAMRLRMVFWRPTKAPAKMKRMLSVRME